jgi:serine/threonine protein kinase
MAELYRAVMTGAHDFHKPVVIKKILPHLAADPEFVAMFIDEAKLTAQLVHPKIVQVFELGRLEDSELFIAMEWVDGIDVLTMLRDYARRGERVPAEIAVHVLSEVLDALDYAHQARSNDGEPLGIVHRDISPGNVLVSSRGDVKLTDFGIARAAANQSRTNAGTLKGKYGYMSPEQVVNANLDGRSDIFACGVVLAEMLMGRRLFIADSELDVLLMVRDVRLDRLHKYGREIDAALQPVLQRALRRNPGDRYASARDFRDSLADWMFQKRLRLGSRELAEVVEDVRRRLQPSDMPEQRSASRSITPVGHLSTRQRMAVAPLAPQAQPPLEPPSPPPPLTQAQFPLQTQAQSPAQPQRQPQPHTQPRPQSHGHPQPVRELHVPPVAEPTDEEIPLEPAEAIQALETLELAPPQRTVIPQRPRVPRRADSSSNTREFVGGRDHSAHTHALEREIHDLVENIKPADELITPTYTRALRANEVVELVNASRYSGADPPTLSDGETRTFGVDELDALKASARGPTSLDADVEVDLEGLDLPSDTVQLPPETAVLAPGRPPDARGEFSQVPPMHVIYRLAAARATGLLVVSRGGVHKQAYFLHGVPQQVDSNLDSERFGEFLVAKRIIASGELSLALAVLPQFGGQLGDTLIGLGLLDPLGAVRALSDQVREKLIDVCNWNDGEYDWYNGERHHSPSSPLHIDVWSLLGTVTRSLDPDLVTIWCAQRVDTVPIAARPHLDLEAFQLGARPRDIMRLLDGTRTIGEIAELFPRKEMWLDAARVLYLLAQTDLARVS